MATDLMPSATAAPINASNGSSRRQFAGRSPDWTIARVASTASLNRPKRTVERALRVTPEKPVEGAWRWIGSDQVIYRTKTYWQPYQTVRFSARLAGIPAGAGVYGAKDVEHTITIGAKQITKGDISDHHMTVTRDGKIVHPSFAS